MRLNTEKNNLKGIIFLMSYDNVCAYIWLNFCAFGEKNKREGIWIITAKVRINNNNNKYSIKICLAIS